jgi:hypothetical protein
MGFNVYNFMLRLTPWFLRKKRFCSWLYVLAQEIQPVVDLFSELAEATDYALLFSCETQYLEQVLNETFPAGGGDIYIETLYLTQFFLYNKIEARPPVYLNNTSEAADPVYLHNTSENYGLNTFIVWIPAALAGDEIAIAALVDTYNLAGCFYTIQIIP